MDSSCLLVHIFQAFKHNFSMNERQIERLRVLRTAQRQIYV